MQSIIQQLIGFGDMQIVPIVLEELKLSIVFTQPLTFCVPNGSTTSVLPSLLPYRNTISVDDANNFLNGSASVCDLGKLTQNPIPWVFGQLLIYHLRLTTASSQRVHHVVSQTIHRLRHLPTSTTTSTSSGTTHENSTSKSNEYTCVTAAIHVRTGQPDGGGRHAFDGQAHLPSITTIKYEFTIITISTSNLWCIYLGIKFK
jgi:hypothetical protein